MTDVALAIRAQMDASEAASGFSDIADAASSMSDEVSSSAESASEAAAGFGDLADSAKGVSSASKQATGSLNAIAGGLDAIGLSGASDALKTVSTATSTLSGVGKGLNLVFKAQVVQSALVKAGLIAQTAATEAQAAATETGTAAQEGLNVALLANPVGLIVLAVIALAAAFVIAYKKSETFRNIVNAAFAGITKVVSTVVDFIRDHWKLLLAILGGPIGLAVALIAGHFDKVKAAVQAVIGWVQDHWPAIKAVLVAAFSDAKDKITGVIDAIKGAIDTAKSVISTAMDDVKAAVQKVVDAFQAVLDKVQSVINLIKKIPHPDLGFLPGVGRVAAGSGAAGGFLAGTGLPAKGPESARALEVHLHLEGGTYVGNDMDLARKIEQILRANRRALLGPQAV